MAEAWIPGNCVTESLFSQADIVIAPIHRAKIGTHTRQIRIDIKSTPVIEYGLSGIPIVVKDVTQRYRCLDIITIFTKTLFELSDNVFFVHRFVPQTESQKENSYALVCAGNLKCYKSGDSMPKWPTSFTASLITASQLMPTPCQSPPRTRSANPTPD